MRTLLERFFLKVKKTRKCWLWQGGIEKNGYGRIKIKGRKVGVHRLSYELHQGPIVDGLFVLHRCDTPPCVNPEHLYLGTQKQNIRDCVSRERQRNARKSRCLNGHLFYGKNLYITKKGQRGCRICRYKRWKIYRSLNRLKINSYNAKWRRERRRLMRSPLIINVQ